MTIAQPRSRYWTKAEYHRLSSDGFFQGQKVQLIDGEIVQMPPQGPQHYVTMNRIYEILRREFGPEFWVRMQGPLDPEGDSIPEPDIAVVNGAMDDYHQHPATALLIVEIADTSIWLDRKKSTVYAAAGVADYWIVNLQDRCIELFRQPASDSAVSDAFRYARCTTLGLSDSISALSRPDSVIHVRELFGNIPV